MNTLTTVELKPDASMIEVMRRFHEAPGCQLLRAVHRRGIRHDSVNVAHWAVQFIGAKPDLFGLAA